MEIKELIKLNSREVRGNSNLMAIYISAFESQFGYKPNCAGCTFNSDFQRLKKAVNSNKQSVKKNTKMENTFKLLKVRGQILSFKKGKKTIRQYDNRMTEEFAVEFLTNGTKEEIEQRKKLFRTLPKSINKPKDEVKETKSKSKPVVKSINKPKDE